MAEENKGFKHIIRIANTDLDGNKSLCTALKRIKGVGFSFANLICNISGVEKTKKVGALLDTEVEKINAILKDPTGFSTPLWMLNRRKDYEDGTDKHMLSSDLKFANDGDIKRLMRMKSYKGLRHSVGLPVRGQRTKSNFRKNKGKVTGVKRKKGKSGKV